MPAKMENHLSLMHSEEKLLKCGRCEKSGFSNLDQLKHHMMTHLDDKSDLVTS